MSDAPARRDRPAVQSVDRAVSVLEILARDGWSAVTDVARELGTHKSTVFRLLSTLERRGIVEQHADSQRYRLGHGLSRLAGAAGSTRDLLGSARPVCERLSQATGETVTVAVLDGDQVVYVDQVTRSSSVITVDWLGRRTALHTTASGKVLLAALPARAREAVLARPLARATPHTVVDPARLRRQLERVRRDGYGVTLEELEIGLNAVASGIHARDGVTAATIAVSGPVSRLSVGRVPELGSVVRRAAGEVARRLGAGGWRDPG